MKVKQQHNDVNTACEEILPNNIKHLTQKCY